MGLYKNVTVFCVFWVIRSGECMYGGRIAEPGEFPYHVSIQTGRDPIDRQCEGGILSHRFIITAAFPCVKAYIHRPHLLYVIAGITSLFDAGTRIDIEKVIIHPAWNTGSHVNNIALLRTVGRIEYTNLIQAISLPSMDVPADAGFNVVVTGWGFREVRYILRNF